MRHAIASALPRHLLRVLGHGLVRLVGRWLLEDVGLSPGQAHREALLPFWRR